MSGYVGCFKCGGSHHPDDCKPPVSRDTPRPKTISEMRDEEMGEDYEFKSPAPTVAEAREAAIATIRTTSMQDLYARADAALDALCAAVRRERDTEHLALIAVVREWQEARRTQLDAAMDLEGDDLDTLEQANERMCEATDALAAFPLPTPEASR